MKQINEAARISNNHEEKTNGNKIIGFLNTKNRLIELKHIEFGGV